MTWATDEEALRLLEPFRSVGSALRHTGDSLGAAMVYLRASRPSSETAAVVVWWPGIGQGAVDAARTVSGPLPSGGGFSCTMVGALAGYPARGSALSTLAPPSGVEARGWAFGDGLGAQDAPFPSDRTARALLPHVIDARRGFYDAETEAPTWVAAYVATFQKLSDVVLIGATTADFYFWAPLGEVALRIKSHAARDNMAVRGWGAGAAHMAYYIP